MKQNFEIRSSEINAESESRKLSGYVVRWEKPSELLWGEFVETFEKGAFTESLKNNDVLALFEHDHAKLLGRTSSGTLSLFEDDEGLRFSLDLPNTQTASDLLESVKRGAISGMSFGFIATVDEWNEESTPTQRTVKKAELFEITVTSIPAYPDSSLELAKRSRMAAQKPKLKSLRSKWLELLEVA